MVGGRKSYGLHETFERAVAVALSMRPSLWERIGRDLDPERFNNTAARDCIRAVGALVREEGRPPRSEMVVIQQLERWRTAAAHKMTVARVDAVVSMLGEVSYRVPDDDEICSALTESVRCALAEDARVQLGEAAGAGTGTALEEAAQMITRAGRVGTRVSRGVRFGPETWALIEELKRTPKLETGLPELDATLRGGALRGTLSTLMGCAKSGKSNWLVHIASTAMRLGVPVAFATLELSESLVAYRMKANLTGTPLAALVNGQQEKAMREIAAMTIAPLDICHFALGATVGEIASWLDELDSGPQLLCVDYADLMVGEGKRSYEQMRDVYQKLRELAEQRQIWVWTATQATREAHGSKKMGLKHVAGSIEKARLADLFLTFTKQLDQNEARISVTNRHAESGACIVVHTDYSVCRFS